MNINRPLLGTGSTQPNYLRGLKDCLKRNACWDDVARSGGFGLRVPKVNETGDGGVRSDRGIPQRKLGTVDHSL
jgi:hypothetical protein